MQLTKEKAVQLFGLAMLDWMHDPDFFDSLDSEFVCEQAAKLGLVRLELYDPAIHGEEMEAEPGEDMIWVYHFENPVEVESI